MVACSRYNSNDGDRLEAAVPLANGLVQALLQHADFQPEDVIFLHDELSDPSLQPTTANAAAAIQWLMSSGPDSSLVFAFVGAALLGCDAWEEVNTNSLAAYKVMDQKSDLCFQLSTALARPLPPGCRLHCVIDTVSGEPPVDLAHVADARLDMSSCWLGQELQAMGSSEMDDVSDAEVASRSQENGTSDEGQASTTGLLQQGRANGAVGGAATSSTGPQPAEVILVKAATGSLTFSTAAVSMSGGPSIGAVAFSFAQALHQGHTSRYQAFLRALRYARKNGPSHFSHQPEMRASVAFPLQRPVTL